MCNPGLFKLKIIIDHGLGHGCRRYIMVDMSHVVKSYLSLAANAAGAAGAKLKAI